MKLFRDLQLQNSALTVSLRKKMKVKKNESNMDDNDDKNAPSFDKKDVEDSATRHPSSSPMSHGRVNKRDISMISIRRDKALKGLTPVSLASRWAIMIICQYEHYYALMMYEAV